MRTVLTHKFFSRPSPLVAVDLLGKFIVRRDKGKEIALKITEVEAYEGFEDRASHAFRGKTLRNAPMFGKAGVLYVYFVYGMHHMINVVTGSVGGTPSAILIRGTEAVTGPGRVAKALSITRILTNLPASKNTGLWFEDRGEKINIKRIRRTPRIGVHYAGPKWSQKLYRFILED